MEVEEKYMKRCIQLAKNGFTRTEPNPMVGAVVVHKGRIIGEGYHVRCGGPHAEVNAIASVRTPELLRDSTLYVSLEPCSHYGKTPPCADLIIEKQIPRVVVGCMDPFAQVAGRGLRKLQAAGIEVVVGVCEAQCRALNRRFMTFHELRRPYVTLKWAESSDHYIDRLRTAGTAEPPYRFSTPYTQMLAHKRRAEHRAILVGTQTALLDNPSLDARAWPGDSPLRLVVDRRGRLPEGLHLFDGKQPTRVYTQCEERLKEGGREGLTFVPLTPEENAARQVLDDLFRLNVQSLLVEGGGKLLSSFLQAGLWDEAFVECAPDRLETGVPAPPWPAADALCTEQEFMGSRLLHFRRRM